MRVPALATCLLAGLFGSMAAPAGSAPLLLVADPIAARATRPDTDSIAVIRNRYARVERDTMRYRRTTHDLSELYDGGAELTGYFNGDTLVKMTAWFGGEHGKARYQYYLWGGRLFFVYRIDWSSYPVVSEDSTSGQTDSVIIRKWIHAQTEDRFYFDRGRLIRWIDSAGHQAPLETAEARHWEAELPSEARRLEECARRAPVASPVCPDEDTSKTLPVIRAQYEQIERDLSHYRRTVRPVRSFGADSSGLVAFFDENKLRKMKIVITSVPGQPTYEYYVWDGGIFFVFRSIRVADAKAPTGSRADEERFYFWGGTLVKRIGEGFWKGPNKEFTREEEATGVLEMGQQLMRCALALSAASSECQNHNRE